MTGIVWNLLAIYGLFSIECGIYVLGCVKGRSE